MRLLPALLPLLAGLAGCIVIEAPTPAAEPEGTGTSAPPALPPSVGEVGVSFTWNPEYPAVGEEVSFEAAAEGLDGRSVKAWHWDWGDGGSASGQDATHAYAATGDRTVRLGVEVSDGSTAHSVGYLFVVASRGSGSGSEPSGPGPEEPNSPETPPAPPHIPGNFTCPDGPVVEPYDTFGSDDSLPSLAWAALKTGFRFAVAWTSESATTEQLSYSVGGGAETAVSETVPTRVHLFVLDGLPEGKTLCFRPGGPDGPLHAVRLANAMEAYAEGVPHGVYTANYLVLVNELGDRAEVEAGVADYANRLWDATDGWVRAGAVLIIATDAMHHNSGWSTCYLLSVDSPACNRLFDVIFTEDAVPQGAASTYRQGVRDPDAAIWMNMHWQAVPGPVSLDAAGAVLTHETGHYLFDMDDLYGDPVVPDAQDCTDTSFDMSIMGGDRDVTEFDDEFARCSTQGSGYVPSWTLFRRQFPEVWDRPAGPDPGPSGNGGVFLQRTYLGP